jgi:uncharacterized membrane protein YdfJ with MMPL/SSD domain
VRLLAEIAIIVVAAIGVAVCLALLPAVRSTRGRRAASRQPSRPDQLVAIERLVSTAGTSAIQAHAYLRPVLIEIVSGRLARRGRSLERIPSSVGQKLLGEHLWDIVRPNRPFPKNRYGPGVSRQELTSMLDVIERL